jgi:N-acetyl-anhydromuramyl-L-alanine amidase AmpD
MALALLAVGCCAALGANPAPGQSPADLTGWPAEPGSQAAVERNAWKYIVVHHSASAGGNLAGFDRLHRARGWDGVAYHFVIDNGYGGVDGRLEVSQRWRLQKHGAHAGSLPPSAAPDQRNEFNEFGIGICLVGNFQSGRPSGAQVGTLARLVRRLRDEFPIPDDAIIGHQHVKGTACPGLRFPWTSFCALLELPQPLTLERRPVTPTTDRCLWCRRQPS